MKIDEFINTHYLESHLYQILDNHGVMDWLANSPNSDWDIIEEIKEVIERAHEAKAR